MPSATEPELSSSSPRVGGAVRPNIALQPTRYGVPALASGHGLRPLWAGRSRRHAYAGG